MEWVLWDAWWRIPWQRREGPRFVKLSVEGVTLYDDLVGSCFHIADVEVSVRGTIGTQDDLDILRELYLIFVAAALREEGCTEGWGKMEVIMACWILIDNKILGWDYIHTISALYWAEVRRKWGEVNRKMRGLGQSSTSHHKREERSGLHGCTSPIKPATTQYYQGILFVKSSWCAI